MRIPTALLITGGLVASLTACSTTVQPGAAECQPSAVAGPASTLVEASGEVGSEPRVDFPTPIETDETQLSVLTAGDGDVVRAGQPVELEYTILNGETGEIYEQTAYSGGALVTVGESAIPTLTESLECVRTGSRVAITTSGAQILEENPQVGFDPDASVVFVVDVLKSYLGRADGTDQLPQSDMPSVVLGVDGTPGVTIPSGVEKPTEARTAVLKRGSGETLAENDVAVLHYSAISWDDEETLASTWNQGQAALESLAQPQALPTPVVDALVGQPVGSQVLVVVPSEQTEDTLIIVVDILGIQSSGE
ncbi:FKBP-type peptidyl-prolyl cis-trans isomerase [Desertivibrio insolitus]|uniref:FKBP-type peptidyl-prolyl cis-trans isomerase n=1 Tax=Herbiconiux sp. SYSU D00978 TaxID=2812562 RepID=UPI001A9795CC|nr:hypothetical protein [Herbiconiux sp. SYSU D00978]